jgi:hypothetical protein
MAVLAHELVFLGRMVFDLMSRMVERDASSPLVRPRAEVRMSVGKTMILLAMACLAGGVGDGREIVFAAVMFAVAGGAGDGVTGVATGGRGGAAARFH